jgi:hypothetical protein
MRESKERRQRISERENLRRKGERHALAENMREKEQIKGE